MSRGNPGHRRFAYLLGGPLVLALLTSAAAIGAQVEEPPDVPAPIATTEPQPIADVDISSRAVAVRQLLRDAEVEVSADARLQQIQASFPDERQRVAEVRAETDDLLAAAGSTLLLEEVTKATLRSRDRLVRWLADLSRRGELLEATSRGLRAERSAWEMALAGEGELPESLRVEISETLQVLREGENRVRGARDDVLTLQAGVAAEQSALEEVRARQRKELTDRSTAILTVDSPPLWEALRSTALDWRGVAGEIKDLTKRQWHDLKGYVTEEGAPVLTWLMLWAGLGLGMILARRRVESWAREDRTLETTVAILKRPLAAAAILIAVVSNVVEVQAPTAWLDVLNLVLLLSLLYLLLGVLTKALHPLVYALVPLFYLVQLVNLTPVGSLAQRSAMLAMSLVGIAVCEGLRRVLPVQLSPTWQRFLAISLRFASALFAFGMLANILGRVRFGALLVVGTTDVLLAGIVFWVVNVLLRSASRVALVSVFARRLGIAPEFSDLVRQRLFRFIDVVTSVLWAGFSLDAFRLYEPTVTRTLRIFQTEFPVGQFVISLGSLLAFFLIIWLSVKLGGLVAFVLGELILPRLQMPQGAPHAVSRISYYTIVVIGVLVATTALGLDLSQATLIAGGLGVGVGFGLRDLVSNFVAGLLLLFERPIRVGDFVELGSMSGTVTRIGMRSTVLKTATGPEIIVPNAKLIASEVVNWTLEGNRHRIEIPIGVAYGTDPDRVVELLVDIAAGHTKIDEEPPPCCLFMGFGDSSLDFQLRAWTDASSGLGVASDLRFAINRALAEADIEMPFPQRDLHLRTKDSVALAASEPSGE